jgi:hypothetical protein
VICFTRPWCVKPFFKRFKGLKFDRKNCHLLLFDNSDNITLEQELWKVLVPLQKQFRSVRWFKTWRQGGSVVRGQLNNDFYKSKIFPISQMQYDIAQLVHTPVFVQLEDDELPQNKRTIPILLNLLKRPNVGLATGVSSARNPELLPVGMGVQQVLQMDGPRVTKRICCWPDTKGVVEAQATGFYCFATYTALWKKCLNDAAKVASNLPHWAFDTWVTHRVICRGWKILADFGCWCDHAQLFVGKIYLFNKKDAVIDCYVFIKELGVYAYWQNDPKYGWVITRGNSGKTSTEVLRR